MKLYRNVIILAVVLGLAVGAYFLVKHNHKPKTTAQQNTSSTSIELVSMKDTDVDNVTLLNNSNGTKIVIGKNGDNWTVISPENFKADQAKAKSIVWNLNPLSANKVIEENASDLSKYGLDKPYEVIAKTKDGTEKTIQFGKKTATGENYYVKMKDSNKVYTIATSYGDKFIVDLYALRSTDIFDETADKINKVSMWKNGKLVFSAAAGEMTAEQKESYSKIQSVAAFWNVTTPIETEADTTKITRIINTLLGIAAREYITEKTDDLSKYGLDNPSYAVEISTANGTKKILFGKERPADETKNSTSYSNSTSQTYAKFTDSNEIFTVGASELTFIDTPIKDIVSDINLMVFIDDISHFSYTMNGKTDEFDITHDPDGKTENDKFSMNGKDASMKDSEGTQIFRNFYQSVVGIRIDEVDLESKPEGQSEATFVYTYKTNGTTMKIDFISKDKYYYFVMKNGKYTGLTVPKSYFAADSSLISSYNALKKVVDGQ